MNVATLDSIDLCITVLISAVFFMYGIIIGSFLNVCIYRIPSGENLALSRSHCMTCGHKLSWYDLFPLFSYIFLGGKCRYCKAHISIQYPIIEGLNGLLYVILYLSGNLTIKTILYCLGASALIVLSVIDWRTYEIPIGINVFICVLGLIRLFTDLGNWLDYVIGFFAVSTILYLTGLIGTLILKKDAMGGGDIKLMAAAGLLIGWKNILIALIVGCFAGIIGHYTLKLIKKSKEDDEHHLAFGPYLSVGIFIAMIWGEQLVSWYIKLAGLESLVK